MLHVKTDNAHAEGIRRLLSRQGLLDTKRLVQHRNGYVYFPVCNIDTAKAKKLLEGKPASPSSIASRRAPREDYKGMLLSSIGREALSSIDTGYDCLGNMAVIDGRGMTRTVERKLASCIMALNRTITTVLSKEGPVKGVYRTRNLRYVSGKRTFTALYRENSCTFEFDARKTFFSNRLAYERARIARLARRDKTVMVMFAGMGPFAIEIAKLNPKARIVAIELNPYACRQMRRNIALNKTANVEPVQGDVRKLSRDYRRFADRIVMPLPQTSTEFLDDAHVAAREGCVVHLYAFVPAEGGAERLAQTIRDHAKANRYKAEILFGRTVRNYSAKDVEVVVDYRITLRFPRKPKRSKGA